MNQAHLIQILSCVAVPAASGEVPVSGHVVAALNAEAAFHGYAFAPETMNALARLDTASFHSFRTELLPVLGTLSGSGDAHRTLFNRFPYHTPQDSEYMSRRLTGALQNLFWTIDDEPPTNWRLLSNGYVIDPSLFDMDDFGADPITQHSLPDISWTDEVRHAFVSKSKFKLLGLADHDRIVAEGGAMLSRNGSLSSLEKAFLLDLAGKVDLPAPETAFRETVPFVYVMAGREGVTPLLKGVTDVMRIAYLLSNPEADLSLKENMPRFKISRSRKRDLLAMVDGIAATDPDRAAEDLLRNRHRWIRLAEQLRPASPANRVAYPAAFRAFHALRNRPETIQTFGRAIEPAIRSGLTDETLLDALSTRPGEFLRRIDLLLRNAESRDVVAVLAKLEAVAPQAPLKLLFEVHKYLLHRKEEREFRTFLPKGQVNRMQVVKDTRKRIDDHVLDAAASVVRSAIAGKLSVKERMGRVFVDPGLRDIVLPYNRRGDSATQSPVSKGSRYPFGDAEVVRLFVHWTGNIDVDLSVITFDESLVMTDQISWTNLKGLGMIHSGDIQSAPTGASEFIDFTPAALLARGTRYLAASVISYRGERFDTFPCYAGFMERDGLKSGRKFEAESVRLKFDLAAPTTAHLPLVFDLEKRQVVFADVAYGGSRHGTAVGQRDKLQATMQAVFDMTSKKPTVYDVLVANAGVRGTLVSTAEEADLVFTVEGTDPNKVAAEMTAE